MLQRSNKKRKAFQVGIYNKYVRSAIKDNRSHDIYHDRWADVQNQDIMAIDEIEALDLIRSRYPLQEGFVVQNLVLYDTKKNINL